MKKIFEFEEFLNEGYDTSRALTGFKQTIYKEAKDKYMQTLSEMLTDEGVKVLKIINTDNIDDFSNDGFECSFEGQKFKIEMSNRGVSLGLNTGGGYSTKIKSFVDKLRRA